MLLQPATSTESDFSAIRPASWITSDIAWHAAAAPGKIALVDANSTITYGEMDRRASALAAHLRKAGAGPESCVGLLLDRSADFVISALAVLKTGAAYLPLDSSTPADRTAFILTDAGAPLLLTHARKTAELPAGLWRTIEIDGPEIAHLLTQPAQPICIEPAPNTLAYVIYTSGSTGRPKGVEITHTNLCNLIDWHQTAFNITDSDRASQVAGFGFDAAVWEIWPHLTAGATLHIADEITRRSPQALRDWLVANKITISFIPTVLAEQLLHTQWPIDTSLRMVLTGADTLHRRPAAGLPFVLVNNYGPSECTVVATSGIVAPDADTAEQPSIGRPITNATVLILDEALQPVPAGQPGELCIAGALVGRGYRNQPQMTAARFVNYTPASGPTLRIYRTGDRARLLPDGDIAFLGRLDDQIKIRGYRIEPGEIAARLDRFPGILASAVTAIDGGEFGLTLAAYLVADPETKLIASDLREFLAQRLPDYMIPTYYVKVASLPLTPNGKLNKPALPAPTPENLLPNTSAPSAPAAAQGQSAGLQSKIAALVASLLGQASIAPEDNFFMAGGHSMFGVQLVARIRDTFGVKLHLRQLFGAPTVVALTAEIEKMSAAAVAAKAG